MTWNEQYNLYLTMKRLSVTNNISLNYKRNSLKKKFFLLKWFFLYISYLESHNVYLYSWMITKRFSIMRQTPRVTYLRHYYVFCFFFCIRSFTKFRITKFRPLYTDHKQLIRFLQKNELYEYNKRRFFFFKKFFMTLLLLIYFNL